MEDCLANSTHETTEIDNIPQPKEGEEVCLGVTPGQMGKHIKALLRGWGFKNSVLLGFIIYEWPLIIDIFKTSAFYWRGILNLTVLPISLSFKNEPKQRKGFWENHSATFWNATTSKQNKN